MHRFFRKDRAVMFELAAKLDLVATSSDASVLAALEQGVDLHRNENPRLAAVWRGQAGAVEPR